MKNFTPGHLLPGFAVQCLLLVMPVLLKAQPVLIFNPAITTGLTSPTDIVNAGDGTNRLFVVEKVGTIKVYDASFNLLDTFLTVTNVNSSGSEQGLLSMAFHPSFSTNRYFFVYYTNTGGDVEIARYQTRATDPNTADPGSKTIIMSINKPVPFTNHNGGDLNFGPDGNLYFGVGDGGSFGDPRNYAQRGDSLLGKMIRINVDNFTTPPYYTIPADNPYVGLTDTLGEIYAFGLRNPWRWSFDRANGDMWIADVGQGNMEEINYRASGATGGINYGWRCYEGTATYNTSGCGPAANYITPIFDYPHDMTTGGFSVTGGFVYRGTQYPTLVGYYVCADYVSGNVWLIRPDGSSWSVTQQTGLPGSIAAFGETESGELLAVSLDGPVYQVAASITLPVTLLSFTANKQTGYNELFWKTTQEVNLEKFAVEYSKDGTQFIEAGTLLPYGNNAAPEYYFKHSVDNTNRLYYRLKMMDKDGTNAYSKIITLEGTEATGEVIRLFPTQLRYGQLQVQLNQPFNSLQVVNTSGQILMTQNLQNRSGILQLNVSSFSKGIYTVVVRRPDKMVSKSFFVE